MDNHGLAHLGNKDNHRVRFPTTAWLYIHYLWLPNPAVAIARVRERVKKGGHNVPVADIRRRFGRGLRHFINDYAPLADRWAVWDNFVNPPELRAHSGTCTPEELRRMLLS